AMLDEETYLLGDEVVEAGFADATMSRPAGDIVMSLKIDKLKMSKAAKRVQARMKALRLRMEGEADEEDEVAMEGEDVQGQIEALAASVTALADQVTGLKTAIDQIVTHVAETDEVAEEDIVDPDLIDGEDGGAGADDDVEMEGEDDEKPAVDMKSAKVRDRRWRCHRAVFAEPHDPAFRGPQGVPARSHDHVPDRCWLLSDPLRSAPGQQLRQHDRPADVRPFEGPGPG